jgi:VanZ family protein
MGQQKRNYPVKVLFVLLFLLLIYLALKYHATLLLAFDIIDKVQHMVFFGILMSVGLWAFPHRDWQLCTMLIVTGALIECIQPYVGRTGSIADFTANLIGIGSAMIVYRWLIRYGLVKNRCIKKGV